MRGLNIIKVVPKHQTSGHDLYFLIVMRTPFSVLILHSTMPYHMKRELSACADFGVNFQKKFD